jgi:hypothetical protein
MELLLKWKRYKYDNIYLESIIIQNIMLYLYYTITIYNILKFFIYQNDLIIKFNC